MRVLIVGVQEEIQLSNLLQQFGSSEEFPDILARLTWSDEFSRRMRVCAQADRKRLDAELFAAQEQEDEYAKRKGAGASVQELDGFSDRCERARGRLEEEVRQFGRVRIVSQIDPAWYPLDELTMALVGTQSSGPAQIVSRLSASGICTLGLYPSASNDGGSCADTLLPAGASAVMSEQTLIEMLKRLLKRRLKSPSTGEVRSLALQWLPHSLLPLLREQT